MSTLKQRRLDVGLTQTELARLTGVAEPNIAAYESGRRTPSPRTLARLDSALRPRPSAALTEHRARVIAILARARMTNPRLFGSVARGEDAPGSDVDLLVDALDGLDLLDLLDIIDAAEELETLIDAPVDIVTSRSLRPGHEITRTAVPL